MAGTDVIIFLFPQKPRGMNRSRFGVPNKEAGFMAGCGVLTSIRKFVIISKFGVPMKEAIFMAGCGVLTA